MINTYNDIYATVCLIPPGKVATYGQVARLAGLPRGARQVGYALSALSEDQDVPWYRVINAKGEISLRATPGRENLQQILLEDEGVEFGLYGKIDLQRFQWSA